MYKTISDLLNHNDQLANINKHIAELSAIQGKVCQRIAPPVNQHLIVADCNTETLLIHTDSASWAAQLRFRIPQLLHIVHTACERPTIHTIRIKVVIPKAAQGPANLRMRPLSAENAGYLQQLAAASDDEALAAVLVRLAQHGQAEHAKRREKEQ